MSDSKIQQLIQECGQPICFDFNLDDGNGWTVIRYGKGFDPRPTGRGLTLEDALSNLLKELKKP